MLKCISFISKGQNHSPLELLFQVLDLEIEWSNDSSSLCDSPSQARLGCWIFILHNYYSWSITAKWLEIALKLLFYMVSLEKFVLPLFVIMSISRSSLWLLEWGKSWERQFFVNPSMRTYNSLWIRTSRLNLMSLVCSCTYLLYCCYLPSYWA
jgi:hypothetical protein